MWSVRRPRFTMLIATCHCGSVRVEVPRKPRQLTSCDCSICRRYGALWAYYRADEVHVRISTGALEKYAWEEKFLRFVRCKGCGCVTHWEPARRRTLNRVGVNARNFDPTQVSSVTIKRIDGPR
jgi:hypothetical protein